MEFPPKVIKEVGYALWLAQIGRKAKNAKPLRGMGGAGVLEIVEDDKSGAYRVVYVVEVEDCVYVLHAFQKKSKAGIAAPKSELDLVNRRLKEVRSIKINKKKDGD